MKSSALWDIVTGLHSLISQKTELFMKIFLRSYIDTIQWELLKICLLYEDNHMYVFKILWLNNGAQCTSEWNWAVIFRLFAFMFLNTFKNFNCPDDPTAPIGGTRSAAIKMMKTDQDHRVQSPYIYSVRMTTTSASLDVNVFGWGG
jgi:hypothetical protein